jgi:hypothetical protein
MGTTQVAAIGTADVAALKTAQIANLTTSQVAGLTTSQIGALTTTQIANLTTSGVVALGTTQIDQLTASQVAGLKTAQVAAMDTADVAALNTSTFAALSTSNIAALTTSGAVALTTSQLDAITTSQVAALTTGQIAAMGTTQIVELSSTSVRALRTAQIAALTTNDMAAMTTTQFSAFTSSQTKALSTTQTGAISTSAISSLTYLGVTPMVLDLDGNGVQTLGLSSGVQFDLMAAGQKISTGWVGSGDGLLAMDRNGNGTIDDGSELFGSATKLADGSNARTGYEALAALDTNGDGKLDSKDAAFGDLRVWVDANADGVSQAGELSSLKDRGITSLDLNAQKGTQTNNGNWVGLVSSFETADGQTHDMADVWFQTDLRGKSSALAQAIAGYGAADGQAAPAGGKLDMPQQAQPGLAVAAGRMADVLNQFDANGKPLTSAPGLAGNEHTRGIGAAQPGNNGLLTIGK